MAADGLVEQTAAMGLDGSSELERLQRENSLLKKRIAELEAAAPPLERGRSGDMSSSFRAPAGGIEIPFDELDVREQIGGGGFSLVHRALWRGTPVAVKRWFDPKMSDELLQQFRAEAMTLRELRHPHVIQLLGACSHPPQLCLVMEYMQHSLHHVLHDTQVDLDRKRCLAIASDVARSLLYLHTRSPPVIHRDVKPANFLLDRAWKVKLCDFGLASAGREHAGHGTPAYMAPELCSGKPYSDRVDVYAFGVMLWEILSRQIPFYEDDPQDICRRVVAGERPPVPLGWPRPLTQLVTDCWAADAAARPSFAVIIERLKELGGA